jgi:hypothetical protein
LEEGGDLDGLAYHLPLSDKYDATEDMRRYLQKRFQSLSIHTGDTQWFTEDDVNALVRAASRQFIFVSTMYKYISERRACPVERLKTVVTWTPHGNQVARPFESLDLLYTSILTAAQKAYEAVDTHQGRDFLLLFRAHHLNAGGLLARPCGADVLSTLLGLEGQGNKILVSDLQSLSLDRNGPDGVRLRLYHKSFSDFLSDESRAKALFVPISRVYAHLAKCSLQYIIQCSPVSGGT